MADKDPKDVMTNLAFRSKEAKNMLTNASNKVKAQVEAFHKAGKETTLEETEGYVLRHLLLHACELIGCVT